MGIRKGADKKGAGQRSGVQDRWDRELMPERGRGPVAGWAHGGGGAGGQQEDRARVRQEVGAFGG